MRRIFTDSLIEPGQTLTVDGPVGHHFARVLRIEPGEHLVVAGPQGPHDAVANAVDTKRGKLQLTIGDPVPPRDATLRVLLIQSLAKGDKVDEVIQHGTELGLWGVWVTPTERSVGRVHPDKVQSRLTRWQRVAEEAASQSQRDRVPQVVYLSSTQGVAAAVQELSPAAVLLLDEQETDFGIRPALQQALQRGQGRTIAPAGAPVVVVAGPEGGFSDAERSWWQTAIGAVSVTLGGRILRTETAGLVAAAAVFYETGELGG